MSSNKQKSNQTQSNTSNNYTITGDKSIKKINYNKWGLIIGVIGIIVSGLTVPEIKCFIGFCIQQNQTQDFEIITQTERGETLKGVTIRVISNNAPEITTTDENGYIKVTIPSKNNVSVNLSKSGYETQNIIINLKNEQNITRTVRLRKKQTLNEPTVPQVIFPVETPATTNTNNSPSIAKSPVIEPEKIDSLETITPRNIPPSSKVKKKILTKDTCNQFTGEYRDSGLGVIIYTGNKQFIVFNGDRKPLNGRCLDNGQIAIDFPSGYVMKGQKEAESENILWSNNTIWKKTNSQVRSPKYYQDNL